MNHTESNASAERVPCTWFTRRDRPKGERRDLDLVRLVSEPIVTDDKMAMPLFSPARFHSDYRNGANVVFAYALGFDLDRGNATPDLIERAFAGIRTYYYSSHSHAEAAPRGRALVLLSAGVGPKTYRGAWRLIRTHAERRGLPIAREACDPSRAWFVPGHKPGAPYYFGAIDGEPIDVSRIATAIASEEEARALRRRVAQARTTHTSRGVDYALRSAWSDVATAGEGARNNALNRAAYRLAEMKIDTPTIERVLGEAARVAGLPDDEAKKTIASGIKAGGAS